MLSALVLAHPSTLVTLAAYGEAPEVKSLSSLGFTKSTNPNWFASHSERSECVADVDTQ